MALRKTHISVGGTANHDLEEIKSLEGTDNEFFWTVPSTASIGDEIYLIVPYMTGPIRARGVVDSVPERTEDFGGRYRAWIRVERLKVPVLLGDLQAKFPGWPYLLNPKSYHTVPREYAGPLRDYIERYQEEKAQIWRRTLELGETDPENLADLTLDDDQRERIAASIVLRRGQNSFRQQLLVAYGKCAISRYVLADCLEAAHIRPYMGEYSNQISNGLLLRADIHSLFDLNLISIDPSTMMVVLAPHIAESDYRFLAGKAVHLPEREEFQPDKAALRDHFSKLRG